MDTEFDDIYINTIKSMFPKYDNEVIWNAIFEKGFTSDGEYNVENVINYLLELSNDKNVDNKIIDTDNNKKQNDNKTDILSDSDEYDEKNENILSQISNMISNTFSNKDTKYERI